MATKYLALLTNIGAAKLAKATALGTKVEITQMAVGDGNGVLPTPNPAQTALVHELRRAPLNMLTVDPANASQIIAEQVVPEDVGGWWIREIGLFDKDGDMVAIANCAETYKPQLQEGSGRVQVIRVILIVSSTEAVTIKIDPSVVLATRKYVDDKIIEVKAYADDLLVDHIEDENPHSQYPLIANALKEMADAGLVDKVLENLGLGAGAPAIGIPFFWPLAAMPNTVMDEWSDMVFLKPNGASFSAVAYPKLAKVWTGLIIPDMRGEFPRIWDDGRGVDSGRALLSAQLDALQNITGSFSAATAGAAQLSVLVNGEGGAFYPGAQTTSPPNATPTTGNDRVNTMYFDAGRVARTSTETRSRNIALNFLIRAK
ncbi:phage tail protein [Citrobacter farmeri]|nr:phage tail protein [Citrobacter farmeri]